MKKEDLTTRLLRNLFHIQGPFDECRQRDYLQGLRPFHGSKSFTLPSFSSYSIFCSEAL